MNICAICHEPSTKVVDNIYLCADCNLTMQSGSRDSLMQTLGLLAQLAKANSDETSEALAAFVHEAWAGWMRYLFRFCTVNSDGTVTMDADKVRAGNAKWKLSMPTCQKRKRSAAASKLRSFSPSCCRIPY